MAVRPSQAVSEVYEVSAGCIIRHPASKCLICQEALTCVRKEQTAECSQSDIILQPA